MRSAFGKNLKALREDKGWTQREFALKVKVSQATIDSYESQGKYPVREEIKTRMLKVLGCKESDLFGYSDGFYAKQNADTIFKGMDKMLEKTRNKIKNTDYESMDDFIGDLILAEEEERDIYYCFMNINSDMETKDKDKKKKRKADGFSNINLNGKSLTMGRVYSQEIPPYIPKKYPDAIMCKVNDDSMDQYLRKYSKVCVVPKNTLKGYNGHVCAVKIDGYHLTFRRVAVLPVENLITLIPQSSNQKYKTETIDISKDKNFEIIGKVVWVGYDGNEL